MAVRSTSRSVVFAVVGIALLAALLYSRGVRRGYLMSDLRYVPKENALVVVTGDIGSLWRALEDHFGAALRVAEDENPGYLAQLVRGWQERLAEQDVPVADLDDLAAYGIDVERGALLGLDQLLSERAPIAVVPLHSPAAFLEAFGRWTDLDRRPVAATEDAQGRASFVRFGDDEAYVAVVEPNGPAVVGDADSLLSLRRAVLSDEANLRHWRENDGFYDGVRDRLRRPLGAGPTLYLFWRPRDLPGVDEVVGFVTFAETEIRAQVDLRVRRDLLSLADRTFAPPVDPVPWARYLESRTAGLLVLEDRDLPGYLRFLTLSQETDQAMREAYGGILHELSRLGRLRRILLAATGYRDGLPELLMGFWGDRRELGDLVDTLQVRQRVERDRRVLEGALRAAAEAGETASTIEDLLRGGWLVDEPDALFARHVVEDGRVVGSELMAADLDNPSYVRRHGERRLEYLLPPVTANDLRYVEELAGTDPGVVGGEEGRLATVLLDDVLWVASDAAELERLLERLPAADEGLGASVTYRAGSSQWRGDEKLRAFIDVDALTTLGLLSPESEIQEQARRVLLDLRDHPAVSLSLRAFPRESRISVRLRLLRRAALLEPR